MFIRFFVFLSLALWCVVGVAPVATAQELAQTLSLRGHVQDGFLRFVITGAGADTVKVTESTGAGIRLAAAGGTTISYDSAALATLTPQPTITRDGAVLVITVPSFDRMRRLALPGRVMVDVFIAAAKPNAVQPVVPEKSVAVEPAPSGTANPSVASAPAGLSLPAVSVSAAPAPFEGTAIITLGSTEGLALAVFERAGYLWIVTNRPDLRVPPQISGVDPSVFGPIETLDIQGGRAYRLTMPKGAYVRPEGGGLVWRLVVSAVPVALKGVSIARDFSDRNAGGRFLVPLPNAINVLRVPDPLIGDDLAVVTATRSESRLTQPLSTVDVEILPTIVGAVFRPLSDGVSVSVLPDKVVVGRKGGLRLSAEGATQLKPQTGPVETGATLATATDGKTPPAVITEGDDRLFFFESWGLGPASEFHKNRQQIDVDIAEADGAQKPQALLSGAKFMLAQGLPEEAYGYLALALARLPTLVDSAEFQALNGAILSMLGQTADALKAFETQGIEDKEETSLWRSFAVAYSGNAADAARFLPDAFDVFDAYPQRLKAVMTPPLLEAAIAGKRVQAAEQLLGGLPDALAVNLQKDSDAMLAYYTGRVADLKGDPEEAAANYKLAVEGTYGPYPVKAALALVDLGLSDKSLKREDAIQKLERFRFGWRGDGLETSVLERLGMIYVEQGDQRRGLGILRMAASLAPLQTDRARIVGIMQKAFRDLFLGKTNEKMTPMEAASVATEFSELMPVGAEGEAITLKISDQMMAVDLLDRAADLVEPLIKTTATPRNAFQYGARAAAIRLQDNRPDEAIRTLDSVMARPDIVALGTPPAADIKPLVLLRAKALSELKRTDDGLAILKAYPDDDDALRLQADLLWGDERWAEAAAMYDQLITRAGVSATQPITDAQAQLVLNRALALSLAGDRTGLSDLALGYTDIMRRSTLFRAFQLVTRAPREPKLADRQTLMKMVSEVDLFKDVLESYRKSSPLSSETQFKSDGKPIPKSGDAPAEKEQVTPEVAPKTDGAPAQ